MKMKSDGAPVIPAKDTPPSGLGDQLRFDASATVSHRVDPALSAPPVAVGAPDVRR